MTTYDCFPFNHELDLLELRLNTLANVVDKHILVESNRTHLNKPKPLYYADNRERFKDFANKIIHIVVKGDTFPDGDDDKTNFAREAPQRDGIARGLTHAQPDDLIIISDVDEIPHPDAIARFKPPVSVLDCRLYRYYFNLRSLSALEPWGFFKRMRRLRHGMEWPGPTMTRFQHFPGGTALRELRHRFYRSWRLDKRNPFKPITARRNPHIIRNAGWHFHGVMGAKALAKKMRDSSHSEWGIRYGSLDAATKLLAEAPNANSIEDIGKSPDIQPRPEPLDATFPQWLRDNRERFGNLILPDPISAPPASPPANPPADSPS